MRWQEIVEWVLILGGIVSLWPMIFMRPLPGWYPEFLIGVAVVMGAVAVIRIRRLRQALLEQDRHRRR